MRDSGMAGVFFGGVGVQRLVHELCGPCFGFAGFDPDVDQFRSGFGGRCSGAFGSLSVQPICQFIQPVQSDEGCPDLHIPGGGGGVYRQQLYISNDSRLGWTPALGEIRSGRNHLVVGRCHGGSTGHPPILCISSTFTFWMDSRPQIRGWYTLTIILCHQPDGVWRLVAIQPLPPGLPAGAVPGLGRVSFRFIPAPSLRS